MNFMRNALRANSLRFRLLASTALLVVIILPITAFVLTSYYRIAIEQTFDQRLEVHLDNLVALSLRQIRESEVSGNEVREENEGGAQVNDSAVGGEEPAIQRKEIELGNPLFKRPFSGWYWQIRALDSALNSAVISDSLLDQRLISLPESDEAQSAEKLKRGYIFRPRRSVIACRRAADHCGGRRGRGKSRALYLHGGHQFFAA